MNGLHWHHIGWMSTALYLLIATASADGRFKLNHSLAIEVWSATTAGIPKLQSAATQKAQELDKWSSDRYKPKLPSTQDCTLTPTEVRFITKQLATQLNLSLPKTRTEVVEILGTPYCTLTNGDRWVLSDGSRLDVEYEPVRIRLYGFSTTQ